MHEVRQLADQVASEDCGEASVYSIIFDDTSQFCLY